MALLTASFGNTWAQTTYFSRNFGNWNQNTSWSTVSFNSAVNNGTFPVAGDTVYIGTNSSITITGVAAACATLNIAPFGFLNVSQGLTVSGATVLNGFLTFIGTDGTKTFSGLVTINAGGAWFNSAQEMITFHGGITNNGTFVAGNGSYIFNTNSQTLTGMFVIPGLEIAGTSVVLTNTNSLTISTSLTGSGRLVQGSGAVFNLAVNIGTFKLTATAAGNTVNYTGASQTVRSTDYENLTLSGNGAVILQGGTTNIGGNLTLGGTVTTTAVTGLTIGGDLVIGSGTSFTAGAFTHAIAGDWINSGTFDGAGSTINFNGSALQTSSGTSPTTFNDILLTNTTNPVSLQITSAQNLRGILTLSSNSVLDAGNELFTLLSGADAPAVMDAAIASLPTGAAVSGNLIVQRYMAVEGGSNSPNFDDGRIFRYISSPVQNASVADLQVEIPVTGTFTGASGACGGCGTKPSMFLYDESETGDTNNSGGNDTDDGYENFPLTSNSETFAVGRGYPVFVRGDIEPVSSAGNAGYDLRGSINSGTVNFVSTAGVSYTGSGVDANDGWNLIGNPFPSTIDWDAASGWSRSARVNNAIYVRDNGAGAGTFATYVNGVTQNGGSRYIPMGQAFWLKLNNGGGGITLTADENTKAPGNAAQFFRQAPKDDLLRITLRNGALRDEAVIYIEEGASVDFDRNLDALKLDNSIFNLFTISTGGFEFAINSIPKLDCSYTTILQISNAGPGPYSLDFTELESFTQDVDIILRDKFLNTVKLVSDSPTYEFNVTDDDNTFKDRFAVTILSREIDSSIVATSKNGQKCRQGFVTLEADGAPAGGSYRWYEDGSDIDPIPGAVNNQFTTPELTKSKTYYVAAVNTLGCEGPKVPVMASIVNFDNAEILDLSNGMISSSFETGNQWFKDGEEIPGATHQTFNPQETGLYKIEVSIGSCKTYAERVFKVTEFEDDELFDAVVKVYPNPVGDELTFTITKDIMGNLRMLDNIGRVIDEIELKSNGDGMAGVFDFRDKAGGIYFLQVSDSDGRVFNKRIFKK